MPTSWSAGSRRTAWASWAPRLGRRCRRCGRRWGGPSRSVSSGPVWLAPWSGSIRRPRPRWGEDGDPVDVLLLVAVVETPYNPAEYHSLDEVSRQRLDEIEHFFISYNKVEGRRFK